MMRWPLDGMTIRSEDPYIGETLSNGGTVSYTTPAFYAKCNSMQFLSYLVLLCSVYRKVVITYSNRNMEAINLQQNYIYTISNKSWRDTVLAVIRIWSIFSNPDPDPRIRFKNADPDPGDSKNTGSDWIRILLRYVFDVLQKIFCKYHFYTKSKHLMTLKIKDKKLFGRNCILDNFI